MYVVGEYDKGNWYNWESEEIEIAIGESRGWKKSAGMIPEKM